MEDGLVEVQALVVGHHYYWCSFYNSFGFYGLAGEHASAFAGCVGEVNVWFWHVCKLCVKEVCEKRVVVIRCKIVFLIVFLYIYNPKAL